MLGDGGAGRADGSLWPARPGLPLEVALSPPRVPAAEPPEAATRAAAPGTLTVAPVQEARRAATAYAPPPAPAQVPDPGRAGRGLMPRVIVNDRVARARFADALDGETLGQFPVEVDAGVVLPGNLQVPYPPQALLARREGSVLAWAIVDAEGAPEAVHVVEGPPEFAAAVEAALPTMRFVPAHDQGRSIRYYVTLEFEFRIDGPGTSARAPAPASR